MTDLTKIKTPFGLLDEDTQRALKECGGPWEIFIGSGWEPVDNLPTWVGRASTYRQAEKRETVTYVAHAWIVVEREWGVYPFASIGDRNINGTSTATLINGKPVRIVWTADGYDGDGE